MVQLKSKITLRQKQEFSATPEEKKKRKIIFPIVLIGIIIIGFLYLLISNNKSEVSNAETSVQAKSDSKTKVVASKNDMSGSDKTLQKTPINTVQPSNVPDTKGSVYKIGEPNIICNFEMNDSKILDTNPNLIYLLKYLTDNPNTKVQIEGYTDNTGEDYYNFILSKERALSLFIFLKKSGISPNRMTYIGKGEQNPVSTNSTVEGRLKNRRVELTLM